MCVWCVLEHCDFVACVQRFAVISSWFQDVFCRSSVLLKFENGLELQVSTLLAGHVSGTSRRLDVFCVVTSQTDCMVIYT